MNRKRAFANQRTSYHMNAIINNGYEAQKYIQEALAQYARDTSSNDTQEGRPVVIIVEILEQS